MSFYDEIEIEDFDFDAKTETYYYPCPCGDRFQISKKELVEGEEIARCPSCSLILRVVYNPVSVGSGWWEMKKEGGFCVTSVFTTVAKNLSHFFFFQQEDFVEGKDIGDSSISISVN
eukprot:TRINITY_DN1363_c0_g1_i2.p1 TRINITY_DN1363_c0_g1~~TRINITY_DN1363_c0_g1_i2.p1  ORF type:complete len:117 (+),score=15.87 TRINITY_DN1363_c0_g1_i2:59-409(+)